MRLTTFIIFFVVLLASCKKEDQKYSNVPAIDLYMKSTDQVNWTNPDSKLQLHFGFKDGGGNIAKRAPEEDSTIIIYNLREGATDTFATYYMPFPTVSEDDFEKNGNLKGSFTVMLTSYFHYPRLDSAHADGLDTCYWHIQIQDHDGNKSNVEVVGPIYIKP